MINKKLDGLYPYKTETTRCRVRLSSNELPFEFPADIVDEALGQVDETKIRLYPDPEAKILKEAIADFIGVPEENILLGNGSDELIYYISLVIGEKGVFIPVPTFPMYSISSKVAGRKPFEVYLDPHFDIDVERSKSVLGEVDLAFFSYPNNPTGNLFSREKINFFREKGIFIAVDEAYYGYAGDTFIDDALKREDTVVLRTLSKIGMAGLRIGVLIGVKEIIREIEKIRLPFNISAVSQAVAVYLLSRAKDYIREMINRIIEERERLEREMSCIEGVEVFKSKANFILFRTPFPADVVHRELIKEDVLVRDVSYMPLLERCLRVSVGKPEDNDFFLEKLRIVLKRL